MTNDFLSSLSSRALHNADLPSPVGGLRPRLASRFETSIVPDWSAISEIPDLESAGTFKTKEKPGYELKTIEQDRSEARKTRSFQDELPQMEVPTQSTLKVGEAPKFMDKVENPTMSKHINQIRSDNRTDNSYMILPPMTMKSLTPSMPPPEEEGRPRTVAPLIPPGSAPQVEPNRETILHKDDNPRKASREYIAPRDPKANILVVPEASMVNRPNLVSERIEITHRESQLVIPEIESKFVPAAPKREERFQKMVLSELQPPTINVTIGRVEVKATTPSTSPKRNTRTTSTMSLDEYLQRRQGGAR